MNRELRRAQKKAEEKQEKEKLRAKRAKREKREASIARRKSRRASSTKADGEKTTRKGNPGRFSSVLTIFTVVFIIMQGILPTPEGQSAILTYVVETLYYLMFSYFAVLWTSRSGFKQPLYISIGAGLGLTAAVLLAQFFVPGVSPNPLQTALAAVAVVLGAFGGQLVWNRA